MARFGISLLLGVSFLTWTATALGKANLAAAYAFDEGSGAKVADGSGNGHDGSVTGAKWTAGKFGKALDFNGDGDHVFIEHADDLNLKTVSIAAWVYPKGWNPDLNAIAQKWEDPSNRRQYQLTIYQQKNWWYTSTSGADFPRTDGAKKLINLNEWTHIVGTYDGKVMKAYVNGELDTQRDQPGGVFASDVALQIGGYGPTTPVKYGQNRHFKGIIDEVYFYDGEVTAAEIKEMMEGSVLLVEPRGKLAVAWAALRTP